MVKKENPNKNKHLTREQRKEVEECLAKRMKFKAIARFLEKDPTTFSYEVKHHRTEHRNSFVKEIGTCPQLLTAPYGFQGVVLSHDTSAIENYYAYPRDTCALINNENAAALSRLPSIAVTTLLLNKIQDAKFFPISPHVVVFFLR